MLPRAQFSQLSTWQDCGTLNALSADLRISLGHPRASVPRSNSQCAPSRRAIWQSLLCPLFLCLDFKRNPRMATIRQRSGGTKPAVFLHDQRTTLSTLIPKQQIVAGTRSVDHEKE